MRSKKGVPIPFKDALESLSSSMQAHDLYDFASIAGHWDQIVGRALADVSSPVRLSRKTVTIEVSQPVWADSMGYMKQKIRQNINAHLGKDAVSKIRISIRKAPKEERQDAPVAQINDDLPESVIRETEESVKGIGDSQLRSTLKRIILKDVSSKYSITGKKTKP